MRQLRFIIQRSYKARARCLEKNIQSLNSYNTDFRSIDEVKGKEVKNKILSDNFLYPEDELITRIVKDSKIENKEETFWRRLKDQPVSGVLKKDSS